MLVFVLNQKKEQLMPCKPSKAKKLLKEGKAKVINRMPFTIKLIFGSSGYKQPVIVVWILVLKLLDVLLLLTIKLFINLKSRSGKIFQKRCKLGRITEEPEGEEKQDTGLLVGLIVLP